GRWSGHLHPAAQGVGAVGHPGADDPAGGGVVNLTDPQTANWIVGGTLALCGLGYIATCAYVCVSLALEARRERRDTRRRTERMDAVAVGCHQAAAARIDLLLNSARTQGHHVIERVGNGGRAVAADDLDALSPTGDLPDDLRMEK